MWRVADGGCRIGQGWRLACCYWALGVVWSCGHMRCSIEHPPVVAVPVSEVPVGVGFFAMIVHSCRVPV